jgi:feruloyl esterase
MSHGAPLATGKADFECGAAGPFLLEVGISSSFHIAMFFGLTGAGARSTSTIGKRAPTVQTRLPVNIPTGISQSQPQRDDAQDDAFAENARASGIDIGAVITKALEAAGLMKRQ